MTNKEASFKGWHYSEQGDYHKNLDLNWSYAPTYLQKVKLVRVFLNSLESSSKILDVGCGEGVFVEEYAQRGFDIQGLDLNYESEFVKRGNLLELPYPDSCFDAVMLLDVFEHIAYKDQSQALLEIRRVLKPDGLFFVAIPNLAHLNSRITFTFLGQLDRTDNELDHIGERPFFENRILLEEAGFAISKCIGVTFTLPLVYRKLICKRARQFRWLHDLLEPLARKLPNLAMFNFFTCRKTENS
ncbi:class I SAM-dependent methyltransferase [Leptolyngbya sp. KIOST-1]|uniref:class I SAM-dependent methyltransferase n=1 Tax=Leptolyngbya sp. KIOST-1 TaxID=1229172 RepID=UPI000907826C|nr:class I SAM-dependent methyltransferase [Leptolyngbya sp. KIOST-1]